MGHVYLLFLGFLLFLVVESATPCGKGFITSRNKCVDDNECEYEKPICGKNATCFNTNGSYYCQCEEGYRHGSGKVNFTADTGKLCKDINECTDQLGICGPNIECLNYIGSYDCKCSAGFVASNGKEEFKPGEGVTCKDKDECEDPICGENATCFNTNGSYYCQCEEGYRHSSRKVHFTADTGKGCKVINECIEQPGICGSNTVCDVCDITPSLCGEGACKKAEDGYECECNAGFTNYGFKTMRCSKPNCKLTEKHSGAEITPELKQVMEELENSCKKLGEGAPGKEKLWRVDGLLERLLDALEKLLSAGVLTSNKTVTALLDVTENMLKLLGPALPNITTSTNHIEIDILGRRGEDPPQGPIVLATTDAQLESHWETAAGEGNSYLGFTSVSLLRYKSLESSVNGYFDWIETQEDEELRISSDVVTVAVTNPDTTQLKKNISLTLSHLEPSNGKPHCVFWDSALEGGAWSTKGCTVVKSNVSHTVCACNHLSSFAVLMALHEIGDVFELQLITWVGLSLSLICLFICMLTFRFIRSIQSTRTTIHLHLCISLFIANLIFLAGITRTDSEVGCAIVAGLLHLFYLAAFCWMCLEGVQLFRMVVLVFNTTLRPLYLMAGGYGTPALIVVISACINAKGYGTKHHCWLSLKDGFIWSFFGPVCVIIAVNVFFFLITVWKLAQKFSTLNHDLSNLQKLKSFTVTAIAQLCVLGTMWIFGCFQFEGPSLAMSYIFTILNSLQGVLVFVMHCLLSKQVREEYAKILTSLCAPQKKRYSEFSTNQSSKSQVSRSVQHTGESNI